MTSIFPRSYNTDRPCLRFSAPTADLAWLDPEIARFVELVTAEKLLPSVFQVTGRMFSSFVPESRWDAPMLVHWLGEGYDDVIDELAHAELGYGNHISTDMLHCSQALIWETTSRSFRADASDLSRSLYPECELLSVFISPARFVSNPAWVEELMLVDLNTLSEHSRRKNYRPHEWHSEEERRAALIASVLFGNEPATDEKKREIVWMETRMLPQDWFA